MITRILLVAAAIVASTPLRGQSGDSLLANERTMDRPITLHKGQIRVNAGFGFSIFSRRFDADSKSIDLTGEGNTRQRIGTSVNIAYGISDVFQISLGTSSRKQLDRHKDIFIVTGDESIIVHSNDEVKGLEDLNALLDIRAPLPRKYDVALTLGVALPVAPSGNRRPGHSATSEDGTTTISYRYRQYAGSGVTHGIVGLRAKYRFKDWAFTATGLYRRPLGESQEKIWIHELNGTNFSYQAVRFTVLKPSEIIVGGEFEYQPLPWLNTFLVAEIDQWGGGWLMEGGVKKAVHEAYLASVYPGVEILITSRLWLRQRLQFTVAGQDQWAPFSILTSVSYNFFP